MDDLFSGFDQRTPSPRAFHDHAAFRREFLGWDRPILGSSTAWLIAQHRSGTIVDLSNILAVVPGGRAARSLEASLVAEAHRLALTLLPPRIVTPGEIPEATLSFERPVADPTTLSFAWIAAVRSAEPGTLARIFGTRPDPSAPRTWLDTHKVASSLLSLCSEIAGNGYSAGDLAKRISSIANAFAAARRDVDRWNAIADLAGSVERLLNQAGLTDRYVAIRAALAGVPHRTDLRIVLIGVPELPKYVLDLLNQGAASVTALVAAPPELEDHFDQAGCIIADAWANFELRLDPSSLRFVDSPREQALATLDALADLGDSREIDDVVVAVPDPEVAPVLVTLGERLCGQRFRDAAGVPAARAAPARLLDSIRDFVESRTFATLSSLMRHPDIERWLALRITGEPTGGPSMPEESTSDATANAAPERWLVELDEYAQKHIPTIVPDVLPDLSPEPSEEIRRMLTLLGGLLANFLDPSSRSVAEWMIHARTLLGELYPPRQPNSDAADPLTAELLQLLDDRIAAVESVPPSLMDPLGMTSFDALAYLGSTVTDRTLSLPQTPGAIDLVGWLELPFDPARVVLIAGMNEGRVPAASRTNPLFPDRLRTSLQFPNALGERARDLFLLAQLRHSRESLTLIAGRRSAQGDPLRPSSLLFACAAADIPSRVLKSLGRSATPEPERPMPRSLSDAPSPFPTVFAPMPRGPIPEITSMKVTGFGAFLRSPYGFYLEHVLNLAERPEIEPELDAGAFGSVIHAALHEFALSPTATSSNATEIEAVLSSLLQSRIAREFGPRPSPAILVQTEHARLRLAHFAQAQALRRAEGWRILHSEWSPARPALFSHSGHSIQLRGRIDRVDIHDRTGHLAVLDYKTGSAAKTTDADHRDTRGGWKSLQLPLYRHLAAELALNRPDAIGNVALGYVRIGHTPAQIGFEFANWTPDDLASADAAAAEVVRRVHAGDFFHAGDLPPEREIFAAIAGNGVASPRHELEADLADTSSDDSQDEPR